jgi:hypothetical protein
MSKNLQTLWIHQNPEHYLYSPEIQQPYQNLFVEKT